MAYLFSGNIVVDHTKVVSTNKTDFPILVQLFHPNLRTAANGGKIQNTVTLNTQTVPADFVVTSDSLGVTLLNWEIAMYDSEIGFLELWVKIPTLSHTVDTTIYFFYDNSSITTYQCTATSTWNSNFKDVQHFANSIVLNTNTSTTSGVGFSNTDVSPCLGKIGGAALFRGVVNVRLINGSPPYPTGTNARTLSIWFKLTGGSSGHLSVFGGWGANAVDGDEFTLFYASNALFLSFRNTHNTFSWTFDDQWHHLVATSAAGNGTKANCLMYFDGTLQTTTSTGGTFSTSGSTSEIGNAPAETDPNIYLVGMLDEWHVLDIDLDANWIATEYNNQSDPYTFSTVTYSGTSSSGQRSYSMLG